MRFSLPWLFGTLVACQGGEDPGGTAVGNPTGLTVTPAAATEITWSTATAKVETVRLEDCDGVETPVQVGETLDLLEGIDLQVPSGTWCAMIVPFASTVDISGQSTAGHDVDLFLAVPQVRLATAGGFTVHGTPMVLELGEPGWVASEEVGADTGDVVVESGALHDTLVARIETRSACFEDLDADGHVDTEEREDGPYMVAVE
jgi:hypothetical protein